MQEKSRVQIFQLREQEGYFDASSLEDEELNQVPEDTICLSLENSKITDVGIMLLPKLRKLKCIDLDSTLITDDGLKKICEFKSLEEVWIEDTSITDRGFKLLSSLPNLKYVSFWGVTVSDEAFNHVIAALPELKYEG